MLFRSGAVDRRVLVRLPLHAIVVNASRGSLLDETALLELLELRRLRGAALDVFEIEPLPAGSPLRNLDNVVLAPHRGGATVEADARLLEVIGDNLLRVLDGQPPRHVVNGL